MKSEAYEALKVAARELSMAADRMLEEYPDRESGKIACICYAVTGLIVASSHWRIHLEPMARAAVAVSQAVVDEFDEPTN